MEINFEQAL